MKILVTGGAGYIGSHAVEALIRYNHKVIIIDNISTGSKKLIHQKAKFYEGDLTRLEDIERVFEHEKIDAVMHFAAFSQVGESYVDPQKYFYNNIFGSLNLFKSMLAHQVLKIIFSSTAAVYGDPTQIPITEDHPLNPINPYGVSKKIIEEILQEYDKAYGLKSICLRYFNAGGASQNGSIGEMHVPETHLIPLILRTASGTNKKVEIFGTDWNTKDGTCIRDYIHVEDIVDAHLLALKQLNKTNKSEIYNLGSNKGYSVKEVITACEQITGTNFRIHNMIKRKGDPETLIASSHKANTTLGWRHKKTLEDIIASAYRFYLINN